MHFGRIVKSVASTHGLSAAELAFAINRTLPEVLSLYERRAWDLENIQAVSKIFDHDFLKYLENSYRYRDF